MGFLEPVYRHAKIERWNESWKRYVLHSEQKQVQQLRILKRTTAYPNGARMALSMRWIAISLVGQQRTLNDSLAQKETWRQTSHACSFPKKVMHAKGSFQHII